MVTLGGDGDVSLQAADWPEAEPAPLQRAGGRGADRREGDQQDEQAWSACSAAPRLRGESPMGSGRLRGDLINKAVTICTATR